MKMDMEAKGEGGRGEEEGREIDLPKEVLAEILWKLPLKSAYQLKLVCKSWNSFISSPDFFGLRVKINQPIDPILKLNSKEDMVNMLSGLIINDNDGGGGGGGNPTHLFVVDILLPYLWYKPS